MNDKTIFKTRGLMDKIPNGMRVIADSGYVDKDLEHMIISTPNAHDPKELAAFKTRARLRHKSFNSRVKAFKICSDKFRHDKKRLELHGIAFIAVCVICQYQMELGHPIFDP
jgi:hypothetical protein